MVVVYYKSLVAGMKAAANIKNLQPPPYKADLSVNMLAYNLTGFLSVACAGLMLLEQYAMRRVYCVGDPAPSTSEYCWHHGFFVRNSTTPGPDKGLITFEQSWILQIYMYFFIRAFCFMIPHMFWTLKFKNKIVALLQGTCDVINDLEESWVRYAETAEDEISKAKMIEANVTDQVQDRAAVRKQLSVQYAANVVMTRSVSEMTQARVPDYRPMLRFTGLRMAYDMIAHSLFLFVDLSLLLQCWQFDGTDFYCRTEWNDTNLHCMLPMLQILQQVLLLSVICCAFMWLVMFCHTIWLAVQLLSADTRSCFLEKIPYNKQTEWDSAVDRRTYKLLSIYLLQNFVVLHPLDLLRTFVRSLERKGVAGEKFIRRVRDEVAGTSSAKVDPPLATFDEVDQETVWLKAADA